MKQLSLASQQLSALFLGRLGVRAHVHLPCGPEAHFDMPQRVPPCGRAGTRGVDAPALHRSRVPVLSVWHACRISGLRRVCHASWSRTNSCRCAGVKRARIRNMTCKRCLRAASSRALIASACLHHRRFVRHLLREQRTHLGIRLAQCYPARLLWPSRCLHNRAYALSGSLERGPTAPHALP